MRFAVILFVLVLSAFCAVPAFADEETPAFTNGFASLSQVLGDTMGSPAGAPVVTDGGDVHQATTTGLAYWVPGAGLVAFTDGVTHYAITVDNGQAIRWNGDSALPKAPVSFAPAAEQNIASVEDPRDLLYSLASPREAADLDCIITHESHWDANAKNPHSTASGLAQFLTSTWATTPQGKSGESIWNPYSQIRAAIWLYEHAGRTQWEVVLRHLC